MIFFKQINTNLRNNSIIFEHDDVCLFIANFTDILSIYKTILLLWNSSPHATMENRMDIISFHAIDISSIISQDDHLPSK